MRPPRASAHGGRGTRSLDQPASGGRPRPPPPCTSGGRPGPPPGGSRTGPPSGGRGIRPRSRHPAAGLLGIWRSAGTATGRSWHSTAAMLLRARQSTRTNAATGDRGPTPPLERQRVRTMRSSPRVVDHLDSSSDSDARFDDEWPQIHLEPADFLVPPPASETADVATSTPPPPKPELGVPPVVIQQLARRTPTTLAD